MNSTSVLNSLIAEYLFLHTDYLTYKVFLKESDCEKDLINGTDIIAVYIYFLIKNDQYIKDGSYVIPNQIPSEKCPLLHIFLQDLSKFYKSDYSSVETYNKREIENNEIIEQYKRRIHDFEDEIETKSIHENQLLETINQLEKKQSIQAEESLQKIRVYEIDINNLHIEIEKLKNKEEEYNLIIDSNTSECKIYQEKIKQYKERIENYEIEKTKLLNELSNYQLRSQDNENEIGRLKEMIKYQNNENLKLKQEIEDLKESESRNMERVKDYEIQILELSKKEKEYKNEIIEQDKKIKSFITNGTVFILFICFIKIE